MGAIKYLHVRATDLNGLEVDKAILMVRDRLKRAGFQLSESGLKQFTNFNQRNFEGIIDGTKCVRIWVDDGLFFHQYIGG